MTSRFQKLKDDVERLKAQRERDRGALQQIRAKLKELFGREVTPKEAKRLVAKLEDELAKEEPRLAKEFERVRKEVDRALGQIPEND